MNQQKFHFEDACKLVGIKVSDLQDALTIRTLFNPLNTSGIGSLLFLIMALAVGVLSITYSEEPFSMIIGSVIGFGAGIATLLFILSELTSYFQISNDNLEVRNRLKFKTERITKDYKVRMETYSEHIQLKGGTGSYYRIVKLYITNGTSEQLLIDFVTDEKYASTAKQLGRRLTYMIENRIKSA